MEKDCVFCKIIQGEISSEKVFESKNFIVIKDANPETKDHSLVIPKKHCETFLNLPKENYQEFLETTKLATKKIQKETSTKAFNLVMNNLKEAGQVIPHLHLHIIPRK
ncbi:MAG: HIT domain-containing protein [archaeon]|nr:HIT domain-containing protein [archaeon]MCR4323661.1 HIT domain-containing protein [Nanoarchaeota archaeon]